MATILPAQTDALAPSLSSSSSSSSSSACQFNVTDACVEKKLEQLCVSGAYTKPFNDAYKPEDFGNARGEELANLVDQKCCELENVHEQKLSLPELVAAVTEELQSYPKDKPKSVEHIAKVKALMESYDASQNDWKHYAFFDDKKNYTRNLIATDNETFTLMLLCWNKKKASPIHDHAGSECWLRMLSGRIIESTYDFPHPDAGDEEPLKLLKRKEFHAPGVTFINDCVALHKVENPDEEQGAVSLHLYAPPYDSCKCFLDGTVRAAKACVTFYSENGCKMMY